MTTVAYHRPTKTLAADRRCVTANGMIVGPRTKIGVERDHIFAVAGQPSAMQAVEIWIQSGCPGTDDQGRPVGAGKTMADSEAIVVKPDGEVVMLFQEDPPVIVEERFVVLGSGRRHAITAMDMGGGAITAIHMASLRDPGTGDGIEFICLGVGELKAAKILPIEPAA